MGMQKWFLSVCSVFPRSLWTTFISCLGKGWSEGEVITICKTRRAGNNSAGAGMGEQDFDFAQADHFLKDVFLGVSRQEIGQSLG